MKVLFTGGTGVFGKAVLRYLQAQHALNLARLPDEVVVLARSPGKFLNQHREFSNVPWLRFHKGDIEDPSSLPRLENYTHVLHAAADSTDATHLSPLQRYDQIVNGTRNLLDFAVSCGAQRFLFISSGAVYGPQPIHFERIPEDWHGIPDPLDPANAYGIAKRTAEHLCVLYGQVYDLHTVVARGFAFVGQDLPLDAHFAIGNFIRDALWCDEITVHGDGTPLRSYLAQEDLARWLMKLLLDGKASRAYNVGSDETISIADLACRVRDLLAPDKPVRIIGTLESNAVRNRYVPDIDRARQELSLDIFTTLNRAIIQTADAALKRGH